MDGMTKSEKHTVTYIDLIDAIERINRNPQEEHSIRAVTQDGTKVLVKRKRIHGGKGPMKTISEVITND
jgi:hypothetical protein